MEVKNNIKITLIQSDIVWEDIDTNLERISKKILKVEDQPDIIVLPEMFATGFLMQPEKFAQTEDGTIVSRLGELSKQKNAVIVASVIIKDKGKYYNRLFWINPEGQYQTYNKKHLFSFAGEHEKYAAGDKDLIVNYKSWRIKLLICYDLRFPVWSRNRNDYDILIYIANWPNVRSFPWKTLLLARAIENLSYVVGVNRVGEDGNRIAHSGDSMIIDFKGEIICNTKPFEETIETCTLSYEDLIKFRTKFPALGDADEFELK